MARQLARHKRKHVSGFTMLELLIVIAIIGVVAPIGWMSGRSVIRGQQQSSSLNAVRQSIWQGATSAAARNTQVNLIVDGTELRLVRNDNNRVLRRFEMPESSFNTTQTMPYTLLSFTRSGKVEDTTLQALPNPFQLITPKSTHNLTVSLIGETRAVKQ